MTTSTNPNIVIRNLTTLTHAEIPSSAEKTYKLSLVERSINPSKYNIIGLVDRSNDVVLQTRFHNIRDCRGRFARVVGNRRRR
jgi:hypothetical protein